jgi:hypothetical protein
MTQTDEEGVLDDLFHGCALAAYVELARACGGIPDSDETRRLAYRYYEEALADFGRNEGLSRRGKTPAQMARHKGRDRITMPSTSVR